MFNQSPQAVLTVKSPKLAEAVEAVMAKSTIAGTPSTLRGYSSADSDMQIVQLSLGKGDSYRHFTMQFNPSGSVTTSYSSSVQAGDAKPAIVLPFDRSKPTTGGSGAMFEASMTMTATAMDMAASNARFGLAMGAVMMGAGRTGGADPAAVADETSATVIDDGELGPNVVALPVKQLTTGKTAQISPKPDERVVSMTVETLDKPDDAIASLTAWSNAVLPDVALKRGAPTTARHTLPAPGGRR
ncbi:MAG: hypothetical protein AAF213_05545 [Pseudomonadota bacterium]